MLPKKVKRIRKAVQSSTYEFQANSVFSNGISGLPSNLVEVRVPAPMIIPRTSLRKRKTWKKKMNRDKRNNIIIKEELAKRTKKLQKRSK